MTVAERTRAGRREWIGLAVLALPCLLIAMDASVLELAIPKISEDLSPTSSQLLWIMDIYGFLLAGSLLTMGALGDRIGRRRLLLIGAAAFGFFSILAAGSTSPSMLIAARALLGVAGATLMPSTLALIGTMFRDPGERTRAIGIWVASLSAGGALGPVVGGLLLERFWWGSVFLLALPIMALLLLIGPRVLPESRSAEGRRLDVSSAVLSVAALLGGIFALKDVAQNGLGPRTAVAAAIGLAAAVVFARRQLRLPDPLIDLRLFKRPRFSASLAANLLGFFVVFGAGLYMAQYMQLVLDMGALEAGLWMLPFFVGFIVGSSVTPAIVRRLDTPLVMRLGIGLAAVGVGVLTQVDTAGGLPLLVAGSLMMSLGLAPVFTLATDTMVSSAPPDRVGAASAIGETSTELGGALGVAVLGSIGTAVYRSDVAGALSGNASSHALRAAQDTLGGAVGAADQLPVRVLDAAEVAFTHGFHVAALTAAVLLAVTAIVVTPLLRPRGRTSTAISAPIVVEPEA